MFILWTLSAKEGEAHLVRAGADGASSPRTTPQSAGSETPPSAQAGSPALPARSSACRSGRRLGPLLFFLPLLRNSAGAGVLGLQVVERRLEFCQPLPGLGIAGVG